MDVIPAYVLGSSQKLACLETTWGPSKIPNIFEFYSEMAKTSAIFEYAKPATWRRSTVTGGAAVNPNEW